ncbi:MAG: translation initiation factor IF-2 [Ruminococcus sp.]|nr:translation initiation factor IF-2 [Ruminococcus sp.]
MVTAKKTKISDLAKDLNVKANDIAELLEGVSDSKKKPSSVLADEEINMVLEHYTQLNQVANFDAYFDQRNKKSQVDSKQETVEEKPKTDNVDKKVDKADKEKVQAGKPKSEKPEPKKAVKKPEKQENKTTVTEEKKQQDKHKVEPEAKVVEKTEAPVQITNEENHESDDKRETIENMNQKNNNSQTNKSQETAKSEQKMQSSRKQKDFTRPQQQSKPKPVKKQATDKSTSTNRGEKTNFSANIASSTPERSVRTVDTRGSYVELDKYNERYEQIAPSSHTKDNYTKKQKINQKSAQKNKHLSKKETETEKLRRLELERARKQQLKVLIPDIIVVSELASRLKVTATEVIKKLMGLGVMATINQEIDFDTAALVADELGAKVEKEVIITIEERLIDDTDSEEDMVERSPVVVVMGHVDHGKTSLLDNIRKANVTASEAGGITQHIGAYKVRVNDKTITFLDTPGHEAFTSMRARGASITDIAILVVAADDGIMPQTVEAINHAKAAGVSIIVAINKMDKEAANPDKVKQELTEHGLVIEEWGGDIICVPVSAKTGEGINELLENVLLVAEFRELKANPNRLAKGAVIEARLDKGRGPIATLLVQNGTLHQGDIIIAGTSVGRVRVMTNDKGKEVKSAGPSVPVEITGLAEVPSAGDTFNAVEDERLARELVEQRKHEAKEEQFKAYQKVTLDNLFNQIAEGDIKELPLIVKADVQGSVEAVKQSLEKLSNEEVRVRVIHGGVGTISEGDVMLANASNAIIIGFNVRPDPVVAENAKKDGVDIRLYRIIYDAIEEIETAMKGMLAPKYRENVLGRIEVRQVYKISNVGTVAGSYVLDGKVTRACEIRVVRDGIVVAEDKIDSLKRFKDDAKEVTAGYECGIGLEHFNDIKEGDIFEAFIMEEYRED